MKVAIAIFVFSLSVCRPASADPTTLEFSWQGAHGCVTLFPNPEIRLRNIPVGATSMSLTLMKGTWELGGQDVPVPANGILPFATIRTFGPCKPGLYEWTALMKSSTGQILSEAHQAHFYPSDESALGH